MKKTVECSAVLIFCITLLSVNSRNVILASAASSDTGDYEEKISLEVDPSSGQVLLGFMFFNVSGLLDTSDFASEPSFISIGVSSAYSPDSNITAVTVLLNTSEIANISEGKLKADILKAKVEDFFDVTLPYSGNFTYDDKVFYTYRIDECPIIQKMRDIFLEHKPSQGFGDIVTPDLIMNYVAIAFDLRRKGDLLEWWITATVNYPGCFEMSFGEEYSVSLKELTGYSEAIQSSPESSNSTLSIIISQVDRKVLSLEPYKLISIETIPSDMEKNQGTYGVVTTFMFQKTIAGSSVEDLSIRFKIVSPNYIDPATIYMMAGVVVMTMAIIGIVVFTVRRKRSHL